MAATFYVWVTLLTESAVDPLLAGLVRKGYGVEPLASNRNLMTKCDASVLLALQVTGEAPDREPHAVVMAAVKEALGAAKASYHSIVVQHHDNGGTCTWSGGNIRFPKKAEPEPARPPAPEGVLDKMDKAIGDP